MTNEDIPKLNPEQIKQFAIERVMRVYQTDKATVVQLYQDEVDAYRVLLELGIEDDTKTDS